MIIISKAQLEAARSCGDHLSNPFWNAQEQALIFPDWAVALAWYLSDAAPNGVQRLKWLAANKFIPMTKAEVRALLKARAAEHGGHNV